MEILEIDTRPRSARELPETLPDRKPGPDSPRRGGASRASTEGVPGIQSG
jgi:hypothetical protein